MFHPGDLDLGQKKDAIFLWWTGPLGVVHRAPHRFEIRSVKTLFEVMAKPIKKNSKRCWHRSPTR